MNTHKKKTYKIIKRHSLTVGIVVFVVVFGALGAYMTFYSRAASYTVVSPIGNYGYCMDDYHSGTTNGNKIDIWKCNGTSAQSWSYNSNHTVTIFGKCLDVYQQSTANGAKIDLYTCDGGSNQYWTQTSSHTLVGKQSRKCLDDPFANTTDGTWLQLYTCDGNVQQKWYFNVPAPSPSPSPSPAPSPAPSPSTSPSPSSVSCVNCSSNSTDTQNAQSVQNQQSANGSALNDGSSSIGTTGNSQSPQNSSNGPPPSITSATAVVISGTSAKITWSAKGATNYIIQYGTNVNNLSSTETYFNSNGNVSIFLNNLPAGKKIYADITPYNNGVTGKMKQVSFMTKSQSPIVLIIVVVIVFALFGGLLYFFMKRAKGNMPDIPAYTPPVVDDMSAPFQEEDPNEFYRRTHWWEGETQTPPPSQGRLQDEDYPDMFEEGNKRLDDEQHHRGP